MFCRLQFLADAAYKLREIRFAQSLFNDVFLQV
jgi:hypothetical protein